MNPRRLLLILLCSVAYIAVLMLAATLLLTTLGTDFLDGAAFQSWLEAFSGLASDGEWRRMAGIYAVVIAALQALFLLPVFRFRPPRGERGKSLKVSIIMAGFIAAAIVVALMAALAELFAALISGDMSASPWPGNRDMLDYGIIWLVLLVIFAGTWITWSVVLLVFAREMWADRLLGRIVNVLLAGTIIEFMVILPIDVMVRRRTDCYCATGTFLSICFASTALLWLAGPGAWIAITSRRHRAVRERYCDRCGHAKGPTPGEHCPECGSEWLS